MAFGPIVPALWFDTLAVEAAHFYARVMPKTTVDYVGTMHGTPSGDVDLVEFTIANQRFLAMSAGPAFKINPSISFMLNFDPLMDKQAEKTLRKVWSQLIPDGTVRMELGEYPFSKLFGWVEDRFGVNWQLILTDPEGDPRPFVLPALMFTKAQAGKADAAINHYVKVFPKSTRGFTAPYPEGSPGEKAGTLMFADFQLCGQWLVASDSAQAHDFAFSEAVSLLVECDTQEELESLTNALSAQPEAEICGWLKDRYGVSWQVAPRSLQQMMRTGTQAQVDALVQATLQMKRLDILELHRLYRQNTVSW
jgi:predicted 3-demethylubiquinone-9 3-methyltransferase (glyoxalase superfamily)